MHSKPYSLDVFSDSLIVSALLNFRLRFHAPLRRTRVNGVFVSVVQTAQFQTTKGGAFKQAGDPLELLAFAWDGGRTKHETTPDGALGGFSDPLKPFEAKKSHACVLEAGQPHQFACLAQLPGDTWLRPSTCPGTKTPMRISHVLKVTVVFQHPVHEKDLRQLTITRPVEIASVSSPGCPPRPLREKPLTARLQCCSITSNLILPEYGAEADSNVLRAKPNVSQFNFDCACALRPFYSHQSTTLLVSRTLFPFFF